MFLPAHLPTGNDHFLRARCLNYRNNHPDIFVFLPEFFFGFFYHRQRTFVGTGFGNCGSAVGNFIGNHRFVDCHSDAMVENPEINRTCFGLPEYLKSFQWLRAVVAAGMVGFRMVYFDQQVGEVCLDDRKEDGKIETVEIVAVVGKHGFEIDKKIRY